jgi:DNA end-binding protein Ku
MQCHVASIERNVNRALVARAALKKLDQSNHVGPIVGLLCCVEFAMAPRPYWKGHLKLSLVSCPIALYPAVDASERIAFRQVNRATGNRLRQQLVDSVTGEAVAPREKGRGYEVGENQFVVLEEEELAKAREEARTRPYSPPPPVAKREPEQLSAPRDASARAPKPAKEAPRVVMPPAPRIENTRTIEIQRFVPRAQIDPRYHLTPYYIAPRDLIGQRPLPSSAMQ